MGTLAGRVTLGILIFQDLWAIAFLTFLPNLKTLEPVPLLASFGAGVALVATAVLLLRLALPGLFRSVARPREPVRLPSLPLRFLGADFAAQLGLPQESGA